MNAQNSVPSNKTSDVAIVNEAGPHIARVQPTTTMTTVTTPIQNDNHLIAAATSQIGVSETSMNEVGPHPPSANVGSDGHQKIVEVDDATAEDTSEDKEPFKTTVSDESWFLCIQEEKKENSTYKTKCGYWSSLWKMAGTFVEDFSCCTL